MFVILFFFFFWVIILLIRCLTTLLTLLFLYWLFNSFLLDFLSVFWGINLEKNIHHFPFSMFFFVFHFSHLVFLMKFRILFYKKKIKCIV